MQESFKVERLLLALCLILGVFLMVSLLTDEDVSVDVEDELFALLSRSSETKFQFLSKGGVCGAVQNCTNCNNGTCEDNIIVDATLDGSNTIGQNTTFTGVVTIQSAGTTTSNFAVIFVSGSTLNITGARVFTGTGTMTFEDGVVLIFNDLVTFSTTAAVIFKACTLTLNSGGVVFASLSLDMAGTTLIFANGAVAQFQSISNLLANCTLTGNGSGSVNAVGAFLSSTSDNWTIPLALTVPSTAAGRRTSFSGSSSAKWCGSAYGSTTVASTTAIIVDTSCTLSSNTAYSSSATSVAWTSGSYALFDSISSSSKPLFADTLTVDNTKVEAINTGSGAYTVNLATYTKAGSCITSFGSTAIDGCPSGYTCTVTGSQDSSDSSRCNIVYTQKVADTDDSDSAYYAFFALLAIPLALLAAFVAMKLMSKPKPAVAVPAYPTTSYSAYPAVSSAYPAVSSAYPAVSSAYPAVSSAYPAVSSYPAMSSYTAPAPSVA